MNDDTSHRCADMSAACGEALGGTAARVDRWLLVEYRQSWAAKLAQCEWPVIGGTPLLETLERFVDTGRHGRVQLIRRPQATGELNVYMVDSVKETIHLATVPDLEALGDIATVFEEAEPIDHRLVIVCTHGRRDQCCSLKGTAAFTALCRSELIDPDHLWQTSHLGGHRFAATLSTLPEGLAYGRLAESDCDDFARAFSMDCAFDPNFLRGRCVFEPQAQAAEIAFRKEHAFSELQRPTVDFDSLRQVATVRVSQLTTSVAVETVTHGSRPKSCGKDPVPCSDLQLRVL